jgi:hypothetical protein
LIPLDVLGLAAWLIFSTRSNPAPTRRSGRSTLPSQSSFGSGHHLEPSPTSNWPRRASSDTQGACRRRPARHSKSISRPRLRRGDPLSKVAFRPWYLRQPPCRRDRWPQPLWANIASDQRTCWRFSLGGTDVDRAASAPPGKSGPFCARANAHPVGHTLAWLQPPKSRAPTCIEINPEIQHAANVLVIFV